MRADALAQGNHLDAAIDEYAAAEQFAVGGALPGITPQALRERVGLALLGQAQRALERARFDEAVRGFEAARPRIPDTVAVHAGLAFAHARLGDWRAARRAAERGLQRAPGDVSLLRLRAGALAELKDYAALEGALAILHAKRPADVDVALSYAQTLIVNRKGHEALPLYDTLLRAHPRERRIHDALLRVHRANSNWPLVEGVYRHLRRQFPEDADALRGIGTAAELQEKWDTARAAYDTLAAVSRADARTARLAIVRTYRAQDSLAAAIGVLEKLRAGAPADTSLLRLLGEVQEDAGEWTAALATYRALGGLEHGGHAAARAGRILERTGQADAAFAAYGDAVARGATDADPWYRLSVLALARGSVEDALRLAERAFRLSLDAARASGAQASAQAREVGSPPPPDEAARLLETGPYDRRREAARAQAREAIADSVFRHLVERFPAERSRPVVDDALRRYAGTARLHYRVGAWLDESGRPAEGRAQLELAVRYAPRLRPAHLALGAHHARAGDAQAAILAYERALALDAEAPDAYAALVKIYQVAGRLDELCDRWLARLRVERRNRTLREHLLEALHRAGRLEEAREVASQPQETP
jgi:tetratricopeptide (TPR) repeat protein